MTLVAVTGGGNGSVVGGAQYIVMDESRAEVSVSVADELQGHGLGSILIGHLAQAASANGIPTFVAHVLPENHRMIGLFRGSGLEPRIRAMPGDIEVEFLLWARGRGHAPGGDTRRGGGCRGASWGGALHSRQ